MSRKNWSKVGKVTLSIAAGAIILYFISGGRVTNFRWWLWHAGRWAVRGLIVISVFYFLQSLWMLIAGRGRFYSKPITTGDPKFIEFVMRDRRLKLRAFRLGIVISILSGAVMFLVNMYWEKILAVVARELGLRWTRMFIFCAVIGLGFCGHLWKRKNQYTYGVGEVLFACMATGFIALRIVPGQPLLSQWVALGGTAYVIARGMNNIVEANEKAQLKVSASAS